MQNKKTVDQLRMREIGEIQHEVIDDGGPEFLIDYVYHAIFGLHLITGLPPRRVFNDFQEVINTVKLIDVRCNLLINDPANLDGRSVNFFIIISVVLDLLFNIEWIGRLHQIAQVTAQSHESDVFALQFLA